MKSKKLATTWFLGFVVMLSSGCEEPTIDLNGTYSTIVPPSYSFVADLKIVTNFPSAICAGTLIIIDRQLYPYPMYNFLGTISGSNEVSFTIQEDLQYDWGVGPWLCEGKDDNQDWIADRLLCSAVGSMTTDLPLEFWRV